MGPYTSLGYIKLTTLQEFHYFLMEGCYESALLCQLNARKMVNILYQYIWWLKLHASVSVFCREYKVYVKIKNITAMPPSTLQLLPVLPK